MPTLLYSHTPGVFNNQDHAEEEERVTGRDIGTWSCGSEGSREVGEPREVSALKK